MLTLDVDAVGSGKRLLTAVQVEKTMTVTELKALIEDKLKPEGELKSTRETRLFMTDLKRRLELVEGSWTLQAYNVRDGAVLVRVLLVRGGALTPIWYAPSAGAPLDGVAAGGAVDVARASKGARAVIPLQQYHCGGEALGGSLVQQEQRAQNVLRGSFDDPSENMFSSTLAVGGDTVLSGPPEFTVALAEETAVFRVCVYGVPENLRGSYMRNVTVQLKNKEGDVLAEMSWTNSWDSEAFQFDVAGGAVQGVKSVVIKLEDGETLNLNCVCVYRPPTGGGGGGAGSGGGGVGGSQ